jgi:putative exporter of polyketide antibiotics
MELAAGELIEWTLAGIVVGLIYKPVVSATR